MNKLQQVLIIANKMIFPTLDGGAVAMRKLTDILISQNYVIDIVSISKNNNPHISDPPVKSTHNNNQIAQFNFKKNMGFSSTNALQSILHGTSYQANRFYHTKINDFIQKKINTKTYSIIIFESIFTTIYLDKLTIPTSTKIILRAHNIEHKIWENLAQKTFSKKLIFLILSRQIKKLETTTPKKVNYILTLSELDKKYFIKIFPKKTYNLPVFFTTTENIVPKISNSIVHLGAMDWKPNIEGVDWFLKTIAPYIKKNIKMYIAGKNMPKRYINYNSDNVIIKGKINNATKYISNKQIMVVPLLSGSGIRIKILEGMALGIPIISTAKGAQGIPCKDRENILIANTSADFVKAIHLLINDKKLAEKIGNNGQRLIQQKFSKKSIITKWVNIINK